jgi:hypothetical protein
MGGVWTNDDDGQWRPLPATGFVSEAELHDLIEQAPSMLPLAGSPRLAIVGREVRCGREWADLVAVETDTGRPVVIEVKLAANADRRQVLTQVLGYAAYIRRLDYDGFSSILRSYVNRQRYSSLNEAVEAAAQDDASFDEATFQALLEDSLAEGRLRAVIVLDSAPPDLVELVGYLQDVTNDRLSLDLVVVTAYDVGGRRMIVPQLVEPDRSQITAATAGTGKPASTSEIIVGAAPFEASIPEAPIEHQPMLQRLLDWAVELERDELAVLYTSEGKGRWVLNPRLPGQQRGMVVIWHESGGFLSPYRTVLEQEAPATLAKLDAAAPGQIGQGNYIKTEYDDQLLGLLRTAYEEARSRRS